ncbi:hypothetical protein [Halocalculus aciditolerans]|nr:hypothetical protein [Halocalculus aciditolerans]
MAPRILLQTASVLTLLILGEIAAIAVFKKDTGGYKIRPADVARDGNLEQYQPVILVATLGVGITIFLGLIYTGLLQSAVLAWLSSFSVLTLFTYNVGLVSLAVILGTYYSRGKSNDRRLAYLILILIGSSALFAQLQYGVFGGFL